MYSAKCDVSEVNGPGPARRSGTSRRLRQTPPSPWAKAFLACEGKPNNTRTRAEPAETPMRPRRGPGAGVFVKAKRCWR